MRTPNTIVYCCMDALVSVLGKSLTGFADFLEELNEKDIPCILCTTRTRIQLDVAIRALGHSNPFIAEGGCGVYIPADYFHLKPGHTIRLGRFTCIPVATQLPAAKLTVEEIAEETGIEVVPLSAMSPRELSQNTGLAQREAELLRQRDFDELFFFAGAAESDVQIFGEAANKRNASLRKRDAFWSLAIGADMRKCVRELSGLYERALRVKPFNVAIGTPEETRDLIPGCDRMILLEDRSEMDEKVTPAEKPRALELGLFSAEVWDRALSAIETRQF